MPHRAGDSNPEGLRVIFDRQPKPEFCWGCSSGRGSRITSDGGLIAYWELDDAHGLTEVAVSRKLFRKILRQIEELRPKPGPAWAEENHC